LFPFVRQRLAALLAGLYGAASTLWILLSDRFVEGMARDTEQLTRLQSYKGWAFVLLSTVIVFGLLAVMQRLRLRSEDAARASDAAHDHLTRIFDSIPGGIYVFRRDAEGKISFPYASKAVEGIVGLPAEALLADGQQIATYIHPDDRAMVAASVSASARDLSVWSTTFRIQHPTRGTLWIEGRSTPVLQPDGAVVWYGMLDDVTARRDSERALRESEERLRLAHEAGDIGTWLHDIPAGRIRIDARAREHFGLHGDEYTVAEIQDRVHPDDVERLRTTIATAIDPDAGDGRYETEYRVVHADGSVRWVAIHARVHFETVDGTRRAMLRVGTTQDITARKRGEQQLRDGREQLRTALEAAHLGTWSHDVVTDTIAFDARAMAHFGLSHPVIPYPEVLARVHPEDRARIIASVKQAISGASLEGRYAVEYRVMHDDGSIRWLAVLGRAHFEGEGTTKRAVLRIGTSQDITERVSTQAALRESEARWQFALEGTEQGLWDWNMVTDEVYFSERWKAMRGWGPHEIGNGVQEWASRVHPDDLPRVQADIERHLSGAEPVYRSEYRMQCRDGGYRWILDQGKVIERDASGTGRRMIGTNTDISARKEMEAALRESEQRANLIIDTAPDAMMVVAADGRLLRANARAARVFGYALEQMLAMTIEDLIPARFRARHRDDRAHYARAASPRSMGAGMALFALRRDGTEFPVEVSLGPLRVGGELQTVVMLTDITQRREAELKIERLAEIMKTSGDVLALVDLEGRFQEVNPAYAALYGTTPERIQGLRKEQVMPPEILAQVERGSARARAGESTRVALRATFADGEEHVLELDYRPFIWNGEIAGVVTSGRDVTQRTQTEQALREAQAALEGHRQQLEGVVAARTAELRQQARYLRTLIDGFPFMVWLKDTDHRFLAVNRAAGTVFPLSVDEIPGKSDFDLFPIDDAERYRADDEDVMRTRAPKVLEEPLQVDGSTTWLETFKAPVMDEDGTILGTVGYARDITERRATERAREGALAEATRLAQARSDFLANMSHEIRTPLNGVLGLAQLGLRNCDDNPARDTFSRIVDSGRLLLGIVNDVLDFAKIEAGRLELAREPFELGPTIDQAVALVSMGIHDKGLRFEVHESPDLPALCEGDALRLAQVLVNLLSNAMKFTNDGAIVLRVAPDANDLLFEVADSGIGMSVEHMRRLFTPFEQADGSTTRRFGGTGLGLAITKHLVEAMGGSIRADSTPDAGSRFFVRIPARTLRPAAPPLPLTVALAGLEPADADSLADALRMRGARVQCGSSELAHDGDVDLVVCDGAKLTPGERARLEALARAGRAIAAIETTTQGADGELRRIERPLRARHVLAAATAVRPEQAAPDQARLTGLRVLAAEDNEVNRLVLDEMFSLEGGELVQVENGVQALERLERDGPDHYDILLTDVQMPEMDGYEAARQVRARGWTLPILGLTAHAMSEERDRCVAAGMSDYLAKPFEVDTLVAAILRLCAKRPAETGRSEAPPHVHGAHAQTAAVDWESLQRRFGGKQAFIDKLVSSALRSYADMPRRLRDAAAARDFSDIVFVAHGIRGTSANLYANEVHRLARETEAQARDRTPAALRLAQRLAGDVEALLAELSRRNEASSDRERQDA